MMMLTSRGHRQLTAIAMALSLGCGDVEGPPEDLPRPTSLAFVAAPARAEGGVAMSPAPQVAVLDERGDPDTTATHPVTVTLGGGSSGATLEGTATVYAVAGVATFPDLSIKLPASGYSLAATAPELSPATSAAFAVGLTAAMVKAASSHTCAVTTAGLAYCWGWNQGGELGDSTTTNRHSPQPVAGGLRFRQVDATSGQFGHVTCGITTDSLGLCWGYNGEGQVGDGTTESRLAPTPVAGGLRLVQVSVGFVHACGVAADSAAYCWGAGGTVGDGTNTPRLVPTPVSGGLKFLQVSAGDGFTCGVTAGHAAYCWGYNGWGQYGDGTTDTQTVPTPVSGNLTFVQVSAGNRFTCGVTTGNLAYCWGLNHRGQLGDGTTDQRLVPTPVAGGLSFGLVSTAFTHTCGVTTAGAAYCWGDNGGGKLGDGTTTQRLEPTPVTGGLSFARMSAGISHSCGVTTAGVTYCWGFNGDGVLGDGTTTQRLAPVPIAP